jgi:heat shock protein HtpX
MRFMNNAKTAFLLGGLMALCMGAGYVMTGGMHGLIIGFLFGGVGNLIAFFYSDKIALTAMRAQPVTRQELPWLVDMVEKLAQRANLPTPRVYVCPQQAPNAFATGRSPKHSAVAITEGMLRNFPQNEIEGVMAHEIAHIKHRDVLTSTVAAIMAGAITMLAYWGMFMGGDRRNVHPALMLAMMILAPIGASLIQMAISRQREYAADSYGAEISGDPRKLAGALQRLQMGNERVPTEVNPAFNQMFIMEPLSAKGLGNLFSTHPKTEERIRRLMNQANQR